MKLVERITLVLLAGFIFACTSLSQEPQLTYDDDWYFHSIETAWISIEVKVSERKSKRLILDLQKDVFEILEDGVAQPIEVFAEPGRKVYSNRDAKPDVYILAFIPNDPSEPIRKRKVKVRLKGAAAKMRIEIVSPKEFLY